MLTDNRSLITMIVRNAEGVRQHSRQWTESEDTFLRENLGYLTDAQIGQKLGRTANAVHLRWERDLQLPAPSKRDDILTARKAAELLGIDEHKISHWCDYGLIPHRIMAGGRYIRLINRVTFERWVVSPDSWIYFDPKKIRDPRLKRLCALRQQRWGDEWWPLNRAARFHGVTTKDVQRLVYRGEIPGVQIAVSRGGRHPQLGWANWYVKKSHVIKAKFIRGHGNTTAWKPTVRAIAWMIKAHQVLGWSFPAICRSMGNPVTSWTLSQYMFRHGLAKRKKA